MFYALQYYNRQNKNSHFENLNVNIFEDERGEPIGIRKFVVSFQTVFTLIQYHRSLNNLFINVNRKFLEITKRGRSTEIGRYQRRPKANPKPPVEKN